MVGPIVLVAITVAVFLIVLLCALGMIPANRGIGLRIPAVLENEESWEAGHRAAVVPVLVAALATMCAGAVALLVPTAADIVLVIMVCCLVIGLFWGILRANKAAFAVLNSRKD